MQVDGGFHLGSVLCGGVCAHFLLTGLVIDGIGFDIGVGGVLLVVRIIALVGGKPFDEFDRFTFLPRRLRDDVDMQIVEGRLRLNPQMRRLGRFDLGMLAASMVDGNDAPVIGTPLVGAYAEHHIQLALQRNEEPACGARITLGRLRRQRFRPTRTLIPSFGGLRTSQMGQHMPSRKVEFLHGLFDVLFGNRRRRGILGLLDQRIPLCAIRGWLGPRRPLRRVPRIAVDRAVSVLLRGFRLAEPLFHAGILRIRADGIGHGQIGGFEAILPWNPLRRTQGAIGRHQRRFVDRPTVQLDVVVQGHRPLPALISADMGFKTKIGDVIPQIDGFYEITDLTGLIRRINGHRLGNRLGIHCGIGHESFLYVEIIGHGTHQRGQLPAIRLRWVVMAPQLIPRGIQQLDQILYDGRHVVRPRTGGLHQGRSRGDERESHRLRSTTPFHHGIFDLCAFAQRRHAIRQRRSRQKHVGSLLIPNKPIAFVRIEPTNASARHCHLTTYPQTCAGASEQRPPIQNNNTV